MDKKYFETKGDKDSYFVQPPGRTGQSQYFPPPGPSSYPSMTSSSSYYPPTPSNIYYPPQYVPPSRNYYPPTTHWNSGQGPPGSPMSYQTYAPDTYQQPFQYQTYPSQPPTRVPLYNSSPVLQQTTADQEKSEDDTSNLLLDHTQLKELECPICFEYMVPPIYQCERGHSICDSCKKTLKDCPTCQGAINITRNYALERIIANMIYPCKHQGCKYTTKAKDIKQHEAFCSFGPFKCPLQEYENCTDVFSISNLSDHINEKHSESLVGFDTISVPIDSEIEENITEGYIIKHSELLFKLCFKYEKLQNRFYWAVQLVGSSDESAKHEYELEIIDNSGKNKRLYVKTNCAPLAEGDKSFDNEDYFTYFKHEEIARFIENQLTYRIKILN